jgi:hypothetical protein
MDLADRDRPAQGGTRFEHQQDQTDQQVPGHVVPIGVVALVGDQDGGDGLHVGDAQVALAHVGQDVEAVGAAGLLEGVEAVDLLPQGPAPVARGQGVVLALDVQDDGGPLPVQQIRDHEAHTLAGPRGRGQEGMQIPVEGQQPAPVAPEHDGMAPGPVESCPDNLPGAGQARGAVQWLGGQQGEGDEGRDAERGSHARETGQQEVLGGHLMLEPGQPHPGGELKLSKLRVGPGCRGPTATTTAPVSGDQSGDAQPGHPLPHQNTGDSAPKEQRGQPAKIIVADRP